MRTQHDAALPPTILLRVEEAAQMLRVGRSQMYRLLNSGEVDSIRIGKMRRVPVASLNEYVAAQLGADVDVLAAYSTVPIPLAADIETLADLVATCVAERLLSALAGLAPGGGRALVSSKA
jgi:excisionase family DNA binding protein